MLPEKFTERMQDMLGAEYENFLRSFELDKYQALRVNPLKHRLENNGESGRSTQSRGGNHDNGGNDNIGSNISIGDANGVNSMADINSVMDTSAVTDVNSTHRKVLEKYFKLTPVSWERCGFYYDKTDQPGKSPLHEAGVYYIQEPSAMVAVPLLEIKPGERVLDLCAAPGGKSTQIAGYLQGRGLLVANEIHPARAKILSENIERMGVCNACVTNEEPTKLSEKFSGYFDKILVDAPCSGEGMFRKNEAACEEWSPENVTLCADRQDDILDCAAKMLRPGGRIVYSTCTFAPAENEGSIRRFLQIHPEYELLPIDKEGVGVPAGKCDGRPEWCGVTDVGIAGTRMVGTEPSGDRKVDEKAAVAEIAGLNINDTINCTLRLWPHLVKGEGHFAAVLQNREASVMHETVFAETVYKPMAAGGVERGIPPKDKSLEPWWSFWRETMTDMTDAAGEDGGFRENLGFSRQLDQGIFLRFGDNLYLAPDNMPSLKGMKVLRPGLQLGTMKKDRFEPSHALALAVSPNEIKIGHICQFNLSDPTQEKTVSMYLNGQTFPMDGEKGWHLITVDGYGLGWGKLAGGIMKNHYPKGLRKP